jgi:hypothetical protein
MKQDLLDPELFFKMEASALEGFLELKPEGKKMRVMKRITEMHEKYKKDGCIEYLDMGLLEDLPEPALKFQKSTTMKLGGANSVVGGGAGKQRAGSNERGGKISAGHFDEF